MKILYIANGAGLSSDVGGSLVRTIEICRRLINGGWTVYFATTTGGAAACRSRGLNLDFSVSRSSFFKKTEGSLWDRALAYLLVTVFSMSQRAKLPRCDIVYTDSDYFCDTIPAAFYAYRTGARWVAMTHHMMTPSLAVGKHRAMRYSSSAFQRLSYWLFRRYASAVFVYDSEEGRRITSFLRSRGYDDAKIKHVMNGTSRKEIDSIDVNPNLPEYDACFVGGLRPGKGLYDIVPIWKRVLASAPTARLAVIGGGAPVYEHELRAEMKTEAMQDSVVLYGNLRWTELIGIVKRSKIFISPSHEEGWGIAICEALTCGKAVIAYDLPAYGVFGDCIEKVERNDVDAFASAVVEFLCNPTRREELAKKGRLLSAKFDWDSIAQRDAQLFVDVCTAGEQKVSQVNWPPQPSMGVPATACEIK